MEFLNYCRKWYMKFLSLVAGTGAVFLVFYIVGCHDLNFSSIPDFDCEAELEVEGVSCPDLEMDANIYDLYDEEGNNIKDRGEGDKGGEGGDKHSTLSKPKPTTVIRVTLGRINVLFVVDNSNSMVPELRSIANQFDSFLNDIRKTDYHVAIITTDTANDKGRFLLFPNGQKFLSNPDKSSSVHSQNVRFFQETVTVPVGSNDDERGIYALTQALDDSSHSAFFKKHSLFMVIIVSDEDERGYGGRVPEGMIDVHGEVKPLEPRDLPDTFFRKVWSTNEYSLVSVHSIIVPPDDHSCKSQSGGIEGRIYAEASNPSDEIMRRYGNIRKGHVGSICSTNYSGQLGPIADTLLNVPPIPLPCFPVRSSVFLQVEGGRVNFRVEGRKVIIEDQVSFGSEARVAFRCDKNRK